MIFDLNESETQPGSAQKMELDQIYIALKELPQWSLFQTDEIPYIQAGFSFKDFKTAQKFSNEIGNLAEQNNHHPRIILEWGKVEVSWWTHSLKGIQKKDLWMAQKTSEIYKHYPD